MSVKENEKLINKSNDTNITLKDPSLVISKEVQKGYNW